MIVTEEKRILSDFVNTIPESLYGPDRVSYILENSSKLDDGDKVLLRKFVNKILTSMIERDASDIEIGGHGNEGYIWMRIHGKKERVKDLPQFGDDESALLISNLFNSNQKKYISTTRNLDFSYTYFYERRKINVRFRADAYFDLDTLTCNMRAINTSIRSLASLEFHPSAVKYLSHNYIKFGLSLITGITGSGKSTTLDSIVDHHNKFDPAHVVIIAAPIEYVHTSNISLVKHREVGRDVLSFKEGVVQSLRQDPDIIVIGEMRDPDTIMASLEVTDTGHKVFSTLHTSSAMESLERIIAEVNPVEQERVRNRLADVLVSVVSQKLVPTLDGKRALAKEVMVVTPSVKAAIKNNNIGEIYMMINQGGQLGMITMEQDLKRLYEQKRISLETAITYANNKTRINQLLSAK
ncbi:MAG: Flp pilus assembly complex ATPase component TadA [Ignavibacteria bacterium]|nr:Flp pilus assembly complex ATPase component TadA [Ignavibacteria bacterium]MBT8383877.1 Flp pilus assembly complex ATPase component TadA [Ignavibacteria bacterium]MBT8390560.1 Flp pilus assembly complex ATPase component TadA [Ignavibacteria bacterium]NNJ51930.1 Flp pilus assembly complex ATPase component TadA [Ignavibacteriaceae bacterium]NNL20420.1 Flp pilus assembly complex ATPase component TadA [Ignavibacteriaceae bacterium]